MNTTKIDISDVMKDELIDSTHNGTTQIFRAFYNGQEYALKAVLRDSIETHLQLEHLMNERNALRELSHPGINKLVDTIKDETYLYFLLEIVYGLPLHKLLRQKQKLSIPFVQLIIIQIVNELLYMHSQGYVYRDLKASNIIVDKSGKTTIIDLGYIKKIDDDLTHSFCGTIHMIAPELYNEKLEDEGYSYSVDSYALGILLYELIVGYPPFGYETSAKEKSLKGFTQENKQQISEYPLALDLIEQLLKTNPKDRLSLNSVLSHKFFEGTNIEVALKIMKGETQGIDIQQIKAFDILIYEEEIKDFGLEPEDATQSEAEKEMTDKFNQLFTCF